MYFILPYILMFLVFAFNVLEGIRDTFFWIEVNKDAPKKYTDKKLLHNIMGAARGLIYLINLIVLAMVYEFSSAVLFTFGFWLQHYLVHAGTYYYYVEKTINGTYPFGFFTNERAGDNDSWFDKNFALQRKFIGRAILFITGSLIIIYANYDILRSSYR
jgi:hypothetical protein